MLSLLYNEPQRDTAGHQAGGCPPHVETRVGCKNKLALGEQSMGEGKEGALFANSKHLDTGAT